MSKTDPKCYPECLARHEREGEERTRRMERIGDLHERARIGRASRGPARFHYQLFMWSLTREELCTLGIQQSAIKRYCTQFHPDVSKSKKFQIGK